MARKKPASASVSINDSVVLLTSAVPGSRICGTGFCVYTKDSIAYIVTCDHVVNDLYAGAGNGTADLRVNGLAAQVVNSAKESGIDLAILMVPKLPVPALKVARQLRKPRSNSEGVSGAGFRHLHGEHYVRTPFSGRIGSELMMRAQLSGRAVDAFDVLADKDQTFVHGNSGSPLCRADSSEVIGVLAFASHDGKRGYAISTNCIQELIPQLSAKKSETSSTPSPPELGRVTVPEDLQKNRFGKEAEDNDVRLRIEVTRVAGNRYFYFNAIVEPKQNNITLTGPARFFLHDTFPQSLIIIRKINEVGQMVLEDVYAIGAFTIGCQVLTSDSVWHSLEFDLSTLINELPEEILSR